MGDDSLQRWEYALVDVDYVYWREIDNSRKRAKKKLDPDVDWEKLARDVGVGLWVEVAWDATDGYGRPPLAVLRSLGGDGWEVVGVQPAGFAYPGVGSWTHPSSTFVLKRPLSGSAGE